MARWWANLPLRWKGLVVVLIPVTALLCGFASIYATSQSENEAEYWVNRTSTVRYYTSAMLNAVVDAESAVRGFIISRDPRFLEVYETSQQAFPRTVGGLAKLVSDNPQQTARLDEIRKAAGARLELLARLVDLSQVRNDPESFDREQKLTREGKALMDNLRPTAVAMDEEEQRLEALRREQLREARDLSTKMLAASVIVGVLGGMAAMLLFSRGIARRVQIIQKNAERLAKELPLAPMRSSGDEIGELDRRLREASDLLANNRQSLRENETRLQAVLDNAPSVIYLKNLDGKFILVNQAFAALLDVPKEQIIGRTGHELYSRDEADSFQANDRAAFKVGVPVQSEETLRRSGEVHTFISSKFPLRDAHGTVYALCGISTDITERAQNEKALREAKEEADRANRAKSEFLSRMSHELRTPMNAILGFAQLLELDQLTTDQEEAVGHILRGGRHLLDLINEVLDISRIEAGRLSLCNEPVAVGRLSREGIELVQPLAAEREVRLFLRPDCGEFVLADRQRLKQVLLNLLSNAIKYNRPGGSVTIGCEQIGNSLRIVITDSGVGISKAGLAQLFTPFQRLGAEQSAVEGTGLGLAVAKRLVEAMGGTMGVESLVDKGSSFWIEFPLIDSPLGREDLNEGALAVEEGSSKGALTVLYIEDNLSNLRLIERIFSRHPSIKLLSASEGRACLELARAHRPDVILLDLNLPDMSGYDVLIRLQRDPLCVTIPVIVISADATRAQIKKLTTAGVSDYLTKPLDIKKFMEVLDRTLHEPATRMQSVKDSHEQATH
jgi:PAS domain S-box-containing protein